MGYIGVISYNLLTNLGDLLGDLLGCPRNLVKGWDQWVISPTYKFGILGL